MNHEHHDHELLTEFFRDAVHTSMHEKLGVTVTEDLENYVAHMLANFLHRDDIFAIKDAAGRRLESLAEMLAEGDVRLNANSFDRERQVHKHMGDFLLFWSGLFPESLDKIHGLLGENKVVEAVSLGRFSYDVVSSFDHKPYDAEAPTFKRLSDEFEMLRLGLSVLRKDFKGFAA
ncbi:MAG: hypothetical protein KF784_04080 [Fimbriimonadaceae bacterium]|nr:hypothetical protein [Fimbriimonadaceae bacterium]